MPVIAGPLEAQQAAAPEPFTPDWVAYRGGDVRAFDRSRSREVFGPGHWFAKSTDICLTNGRIWFWVGNAGLPPFLNVYSLGSGSWRQSGYLWLSEDDSANVLLGARLLRVTPDSATVVIDQLNRGPIYVTLNRGERFVRIQHGTSTPPTVSGARYCRWDGLPPSADVPDLPVTGKFNNGLRQHDGDDVAEFDWPKVDKSRWTVAYWWLPNAASTTLATSGLLSLYDTSGTHVVDSGFDTDDNKIHSTIGPVTLHGDVISFTADQPIFVAHRISPEDGIALSVKASAAIAHTKNDSIDIGTSLDLDLLRFLGHGVGTWGAGTWGVGTWGSGIAGRGVFDNLMVCDQYLDDSVIEDLANATTGLGGLNGLEGSLVYYVPFDIDPVMSTPTASDGTIVDASNGTDGLRRFVTTLNSSGLSSSGFGFARTSTVVEFAAGTLDNSTGDQIANMQAALSAVNEQRVRVR